MLFEIIGTGVITFIICMTVNYTCLGDRVKEQSMDPWETKILINRNDDLEYVILDQSFPPRRSRGSEDV